MSSGWRLRAQPAVERELLGEVEDLGADMGELGGVVAVVERVGDPAGDLRISGSFMPRVVRAGVPMRMPLGFMGGLVS